MQGTEEIDMATFWNSGGEMPVSQQPLTDREEERRTRLLLPISTIDWQSTNSTHFLAVSGLDFLTDVGSLIIQQSIELLDGGLTETRTAINKNGILKVPPKNQRLHSRDSSVMEDEKQLQDYGLTSHTAKVQNPATVGLTIRDNNDEFEPLELTPYSAPPDLPDVMKSQEINGQEQST